MNFANLRKTSRNRNLHIKCTVREGERDKEREKEEKGKREGSTVVTAQFYYQQTEAAWNENASRE